MNTRNFLYTVLFLSLIVPAAAEEGSSSLDIKGFIENENIISTYTQQNLADIFKKNELHNKLEIRTGREDLYAFVIMNLYATPVIINKDYPYSPSFKISRNGRISGESYEMNFNEAYINATYPVVRLRAGNQVYGWGTADVFNPTSYFNPMDLREFIFKDEDERVFGVPSLSAMWFIGDYTLETVVVPVQVPSEIQTSTSYWAIKEQKGPFPVVVETPEALPAELKYAGYGMRFSGTFFGVDSSLSAYYGPDREPLMRPTRTIINSDMPVSILVEPEYRMMAAAGFDMSMVDVAGKTGTTTSDNDRWFMGYTPYYVGGVWFGYDMPRSLSGFSASASPAVTIWDGVMTILHEKILGEATASGYGVKSFVLAEGVVTATYCKDSGKLITDACKADPRGDRSETGYFTADTVPKEECDIHVLVDYDKTTGGVACLGCPAENIIQYGLIK